MKRKILMIMAFVGLSLSSFSELKLASLFADGMVIQREQATPVWGWADPGAEVSVQFGGETMRTVADAAGSFMVRLKKLKASASPRLLTVKTGSESIEVGNVLVGEVWLCSGQSNMSFEVERGKDAQKEQAAADFPQIRMFITEKQTSPVPAAECLGSWSVCSPETVGRFSAAAYFFGRKLHQELNVPIGLIHSSWGGTCIETWSPMESLKAFPSAMKVKKNYDAGEARFTDAGEELRLAKVTEKWQIRADKAKAAGRDIPRKPTKRVRPRLNQNYPSNLYNAMIHPMIPYGIRGAIWYQGERNAKTCTGALEYQKLLENLVTEWRSDWKSDFPFYAVQLVNYKKPTTKPAEDTAWVFIRESFLKFQKEFDNAGIVVGIDVGEEKDIHPKNKQAIGLRLAHQALAKTYGQPVVAGGPVYESATCQGNQMILSFSEMGSGLAVLGKGALKTFAVAGADRIFVSAQAQIVDGKLVVSAAGVRDPKSVRYAWSDNPVGCNFGNKEGFPASPFRTDDWEPTEK